MHRSYVNVKVLLFNASYDLAYFESTSRMSVHCFFTHESVSREGIVHIKGVGWRAIEYILYSPHK